MTGLRARVTRGLGWRGLADVTQVVLQVAFTAVLARLLGLADFGLAAMCLIFLRFVNALANVGFGAAVIQSQEITPGQISGIFVIQLLVKCGVLGISLLAAPLAADFFEQPQLVDLIRVLAFVILLEGFSFPQTLARKQLHFRGYSLLELGSLVTGNVLGIALALSGFGVWSLIARSMAEKAVYAAVIWPVVGWRPAKPTFRGIGPYLSFGFSLFASSTVYFFSQHLAAVIIGKFIGVEALGLYNVAYNLGIVPAQKIQSVFATVLMPAFAALQKAPERMLSTIRGALFSVGALFVPLMLGLSATASSFVVAVYGPKWAEAGEFLTVLALVGLLKGLEHLLRSVLIAAAQANRIFFVTAIEAAVAVPALWIASTNFGVWGVILSYLAVSLLAFLLTGLYVQRLLRDARVLLHAFGRSLGAGALMLLAVLLIPRILAFQPLESLVIQVGTGVAVYAALRWLLLTATERQLIRAWPLFRRSSAPS